MIACIDIVCRNEKEKFTKPLVSNDKHRILSELPRLFLDASCATDSATQSINTAKVDVTFPLQH